MASNKNASLFRALSAQADMLGCSAAKEQFPVLLRSIAERRRVTSVEFCPLLVDAMLTTHPGGFRILSNSNGADASQLRARYEQESPQQLLPARLRFSLAHELAHTLFFNLSEAPPKVAKEFRAGGARTALENLERSCNKLAAHLLLPTSMLMTAFLRMKSVTPSSLLELARVSGVSAEVLIRRLAGADSLLVDRYFRGCIALIEQTGDQSRLTAIAKPNGMNIARDLLLANLGESWEVTSSDGIKLLPDRLPNHVLATLAVETQRASTVKPYNILSQKIGTFGSVDTFLLVFEEEGT